MERFKFILIFIFASIVGWAIWIAAVWGTVKLLQNMGVL
jgi:hypothetical protein